MSEIIFKNTIDAQAGILLPTGDIQASLDDKVDTADVGAPNGIATLDGAGKVPIAQLPASIFIYKGTYNATTNTPTLSDGTGVSGWLYRVTVAGTQNFGSGPITFAVGDYVIYNSDGVWEKSDTTDAVLSVNGLSGVVVLDTDDIAEGVNLYFTNQRAKDAVGTVTGIIKGNGSTVVAATSGTDYSAGTSALATGILKSTTTTGALTIAVAGDFPTLNQNTTGSAATLTTPRLINGTSFNGSADISSTVAIIVGVVTNVAVTANNPIKFDNVLLNSGSSYSTSTGLFTVPVGKGGVYSVSFTGLTTVTSSGPYIALNGVMQQTLCTVTSATYGSGTQYVQANAGDTISVYSSSTATFVGSTSPAFNTSMSISKIN